MSNYEMTPEAYQQMEFETRLPVTYDRMLKAYRDLTTAIQTRESGVMIRHRQRQYNEIRADYFYYLRILEETK